MGSLFDWFFPALLLLSFAIFLLYQIFRKNTAKEIVKSNLYFAHSNNTGIPADKEMQIVTSLVKPNYLGSRSDGN